MLRALISLLTLVLVAEGCAAAGRSSGSAPAPGDPLPEVLAVAERRRPIPGPLLPSPEFARAIERGTRTRTGAPGARYWQQWSEYTIAAELDTVARRITGSGRVKYANRSPDTLRSIAVQLYANVYRADARRNVTAPITEGIRLTRVTAQGVELLEAKSALPATYTVDGTIGWLRLPRPLNPGATVELAIDWVTAVAPEGGIREGTDGEVFHIAYWYPQIAVYDDVVGWQTDLYLGNAEFYMGYGDYDVRLTVPHGWLVGATGTLQNAEAVLTPATRARLALAERSGAVVHVVSDAERAPGTSTLRSASGKLTWHFRARNVRDFAWATSSQYLWDATLATGSDVNRDGTLDTAAVHALYRPSRRAWAWDSAAHYARHSLEFLSRLLWPYAQPQMTAIDGIDSCGGMEFPMITCIGGSRDTLALYSVLVHEIGHMWFPMEVGSDEKRHAWQDEGLTRFNQSLAMNGRYRGYDRFQQSRDNYFTIVRAGEEVELMRHGDQYPLATSAYSRASYDKMSLNLLMLRALLGEETFLRGYREYGRQWRGKHPRPYDFWNTMEAASGRDLDWFWHTWWMETWTLDQSLRSVRVVGDSAEIEIVDRGFAPMPVRLAITRQGGEVERVEVPVDVWLRGATRHIARVRATPSITRVEIDPEQYFLDVDRTNQLWGATPASASPTRAAPPGQ
jgi:hypothetical protein